MITMITIYSLFVVPFILVFSDVYEYCPESAKKDPKGNPVCDAKEKIK
jgi:hypothetical protein